MRKVSNMFIVVSLAICFILNAGTIAHAEGCGLSQDERLAEAKEAFEKAEKYMERGNKRLKSNPGKSQKSFEHAEDYFVKARFLYQELGNEYGIDVTKEVELSAKRESRAHVLVNKARNAWRHTGAF